MPETVEMLCLANSRKHNGRCVAGLRTDGNGWIRPIGRNALKILMERHYQYPNGDEVLPLDLVRLTVDCPIPSPHHPEDWYVTGARWELVSRPAPGDIAVELLRSAMRKQTGVELLGSATDRISFASFQRKPADSSLAIVWAKGLRWVITRGGEYNKRRTRVRFTLGKGDTATEYDLALTDMEWTQRLSALPPGEYEQEMAPGITVQDRVLLTVSLSEPLGENMAQHENGMCYKLAAAVIVVPQEWRGKQ
jgi:hypothetical protein